MQKSSIFLIGPMGAGKTTIGRQLARRLNMDFYDSDRIIEERTGADIPLIFEKEGEAGFRQREAAVIDEFTQKSPILLATGGGVVLDKKNRQHLKSRGTVFYLSSDLKSLLERTHKDKNRPLLHAEESPEVILTRLIEQRDPLYRETADYIVDTSNDSLRHVIQVIIGHLDISE
ncbi:MAG: shikimate kinase AroK [Gammaproteobacteria bacterium]